MNNNALRIAIDGGAATGKSTVSKIVANELSIKYINTGQMYRLFALFAIRNNLTKNEEKLSEKLLSLNLDYNQNGQIISDSLDFTYEELSGQAVSSMASIISSLHLVRIIATKKQIEIGKQDGVLLEGRDIGTIIMKDATHKFFIIASPEEAARRRVRDYKNNGYNISYEETLKDIIERNKRDQEREIAPLIPSANSHIINTDNKSIKKVVREILEVING